MYLGLIATAAGLIEVNGACLRVALPKIGAAYGLELECSPKVGNEFIVVRFDRVLQADALTRISKTFEATWQKMPSGKLRLVRTPEQDRLRRLRDQKLRIKELRDAIEDVTKVDRSPWPAARADELINEIRAKLSKFTPEVVNKISDYERGLPLAMATRSALSLISNSDLSDLEPPKRIVWASRPTALQHGLAPHPLRIFNEAISATKLWRQLLRDSSISRPIVEGSAYPIQMLDELTEPFHEVKKVTLSLEVPDPLFSSGDVATLQLWDDNQFIVKDYRQQLRTPTPSAKLPTFPEFKFRVELDQFQQQLIKVPQFGTPTVPQNRSDIVGQPTKFEPLSLLTGPLLVQWATKGKLNLVANLSDAVAFSGIRQSSLPGSNFLVDYFHSRVSAEVDGHWVSVRPKFSSESENSCDRAVLQEYLKEIRAKVPSLATLARIIAKLPPNSKNALPFFWESLLTGSSQIVNLSNPLFRFYGSLSREQRLATDGAGLGLQRLSQSQTSDLQKILLNERDRVRIEMYPGFDQGKLQLDPTELLANGFPLVTNLTAKLDDGWRVIPSSRPDGTYTTDRGWSPEIVAWTIYQVEKSPTGAERLGNPRSGNFSMFLQTTLRLILTLSGDLLARAEVGLESQHRPSVPYAELPEFFRKQVEVELERFKKNPPRGDGIFSG